MLKTVFLASSILMCGFAVAQFSPKTKLDHIAIVVTDLDSSALFYSEILGLKEITNQTGKANIRWFAFEDSVELHLIEKSKEGIRTTKDVHLALAMDGFQSYLKFLKKREVVFESWPGIKGVTNKRPDGITQIYLQDPDGYWIEVNDVNRFD